MVLTNSTIETINYAYDISIDYNIKLFLIFLVFIFSVAMLYLSKKIDRTEAMNDTFYKIMFSISCLLIMFSFLSPFLLLRTVPLELLLTFVFIGYSILISVGLIYWIYWAGKSFLSKFFGVKFNSGKRESRSQTDYRSYK